MLKVLHLIDSLKRGGAETLVAGVAASLKGFEHHIILLKDEIEFEVPGHVRVTCIAYQRKSDLLGAVRAIRKYVAVHQIDLVHAHLLTSALLARLAKGQQHKLITSFHNVLSKSAFKTSKISYLLEKWYWKKDDVKIFVSQAVKSDYEAHIGAATHTRVLYNYVEDRYFKTGPPHSTGESMRMVCTGSLKLQKNYPFLIGALADCKVAFTLDIYGDGPEKHDLTQRLQEHDLTARVQLKGTSKNLHELLPQYDLFVMASTYEGFGIAPFEAMAAGLPCLLSDIPAFQEIIGDSALYFDPYDANHFTSQLEALASNPSLRGYYSKKGKEKALKIASKKSYLEQLSTLYRNTIEHIQ